MFETVLENWTALPTARTQTTIDSCYELAMSTLPCPTYHRKSKEIPRHILCHPLSPGVLMAQGRNLRGQPGSRMNQPLFENTYHANRSVAGSSTACKGLSVTKSCLHQHRMHRHACKSNLCNGTTEPLRDVLCECLSNGEAASQWCREHAVQSNCTGSAARSAGSPERIRVRTQLTMRMDHACVTNRRSLERAQISPHGS